MKSIVLIDHEPMTIRRKQIFHIIELRAAGFSVECWDCSQYFHSGMKLVDTLNESYIRRFESLEQITRALEDCDIDNTIFIVETFNVWKNRKFFRQLSVHHCYTVRMELYATANLPEISILQKIIHSSPSKIAQGILNKIRHKALNIYNKIYNVIGYNEFIGSGSNPAINLHINHPDWEKYISSKNESPILSDNYAVFLDEFFPCHPDLHFSEGNYIANKEDYHRTLLAFFDTYEHQTGNRVVIALHPKSGYDSKVFGGRDVVKYKTVELVRDASAVFMHASAALSFVIMYDKPLVLLTTNGYTKTSALYTNILRISKLADQLIWDIDADNYNVEPRRICATARQKYIYDYLTSPDIKNQKTVHILIEHFKNCNSF